ncbi:hypothetical protein [Tardiphaga sp. 11_C7_N12_6]|uniref:hypothetical protein n=1 Tax=Tardiphaga sp. 11_C7_N12_6 TaxID=3240789 RepID=UPI003F2542D3
MGIVNDLIVGITGGVLSADLIVYHKRWCRWIIGAAVRRIPDNATRLIKHEEWLAALDETEGVIPSFWHAAGCFVGAPKTVAKERRALVGKIRVLIKVSKQHDEDIINRLAAAFRSPIFVEIAKASWRVGEKLAFALAGSSVAWLFGLAGGSATIFALVKKLF